ncbi:MAG: hypothetical protein JW883_12460 [Deltaproteobacteria bacterium]|nr:hypothetical protein [Deltaproteobacteria bacterium]
MGLLSGSSDQAAGMTVGQVNQVLAWVDEMLSRNLLPEERERFFGAKKELEDILKAYQWRYQRNKAHGLLSGLMERQTPGVFMGEELARGSGRPEGIFPPENTAPDLIHPDDYRQPLETVIRNIRPNTSWGDPMAINPNKVSFEEVQKRQKKI